MFFLRWGSVNIFRPSGLKLRWGQKSIMPKVFRNLFLNFFFVSVRVLWQLQGRDQACGNARKKFSYDQMQFLKIYLTRNAAVEYISKCNAKNGLQSNRKFHLIRTQLYKTDVVVHARNCVKSRKVCSKNRFIAKDIARASVLGVDF